MDISNHKLSDVVEYCRCNYRFGCNDCPYFMSLCSSDKSKPPFEWTLSKEIRLNDGQKKLIEVVGAKYITKSRFSDYSAVEFWIEEPYPVFTELYECKSGGPVCSVHEKLFPDLPYGKYKVTQGKVIKL